MRLYEIAKQRGVDAKKLLLAVKAAGFEVKSTLVAVDDDVTAWIAKQPDEALAPPPKEKKPKKKAAKKAKTTVKKKTAKKSAAASKDEKPTGKTAVKTRKPLKPAKEKEEEVKPETAVADESEAEASASAAKEAKAAGKARAKPKKKPTAKDKKTAKAKERRTSEEPIAPEPEKDASPSPLTDIPEGEEGAAAETADSEGSLILDEEISTKQTGQKHKRADFKSKVKAHNLPAGFVDIDSAYTRSLTSSRAPRRSPRARQMRRGRRGRSKRRAGMAATMQRDPDAVYTITPGMTVRDLSIAIGIKLGEIMGFLMKSGSMFQVNDILPEDEIKLIAEEFGVKIEWKAALDLEAELEENLLQQQETSQKNRVSRPPIITFLGHVDHGKTSLLDKIRKSRVTAGESGGITQHFGAYCVEKSGHTITFLDTPGHEAFTAMRARGASLTDIAVLVVAADDGVMPQTEEACSHARNAGVPIVVAINKCDIPNANPDRVRQELSTRLELLPEEWGGQIGMVNVSAITGDGIDALLERILLEAEMLELSADPGLPATGHVLEAKVSENRGIVATLLVADGTLHRGDIMLCATGYGKIKLMYDEHGKTVNEVMPGRPARVVGLSSVPDAGDKFYVLDDLAKAKAIAEQRQHASRAASLSRRAHVTLENLQSHLANSQVRELNVIIKADVMGSLEVLQKTLRELSTDEVRIKIIHAAVGGINQADVILADASDAIILGFHVVADQIARLQAASHNVQIKVYHIIYRLIEDMKAALEGMLPPEEKEVIQGQLEIRQVFRASRFGNIAGCYVTDGVVTRTSRVRLIRDSVVIYDGTIASLRRVKDDAREVKSGYECGLKIAGYDDIKEGDIIEAYTIEEIARTLD